MFFFIILCCAWELNSDDLSENLKTVSYMVVINERSYVLDHLQGLIYEINDHGKEVNRFGRKGMGPGEFQRGERLLHIPGSNLLAVSDISRQMLVYFQLDGTPEKSIPSEYKKMRGALLRNGGNLWIQTEDALHQPNRGASVVVEKNKFKKTIKPFHSDDHQDPHLGKAGQSVAYFEYPWDYKVLIAPSPCHELVYIGSNKNIDFAVFDMKDFKQIGKVQDLQSPPPLIDSVIENHSERIRIGGVIWSAERFEHNEFMPVIRHCFVDTEKRIWIQINTHKDRSEYWVYNRMGQRILIQTTDLSDILVYATNSHYWGYSETDDGIVIFRRAY